MTRPPRRRPRRRLAFATAALLAAALSGLNTANGAPPVSSPELDALLKPIRDRHDVPGLAGAVVEGDASVTLGAAGLRKRGANEPFTVGDLVHLGSCTKSMTATRIALLVDEGKLSWSSTVAQVFPDLAPGLHPDARGITLDQLLTHRAGLPHDVAYAFLPGGTVGEKRLAALKAALSKPPATPPGTKMEYSNIGYIIAGAMAERVTGRSWEDLMRDGLFRPLGMTESGFGPPGTPGKVDQPWGHSVLGFLKIPSQSDNPPVLGPAGRVHASLTDWGRYAAFHLHGRAPGGLSLKPATLEHLHTPPPGADYACGWLVRTPPWDPGTRAIWHNGSNTMWYAQMWVVPGRDHAILAVTNQAGDAATRACDEACDALAAWRKAHRPH